MSEWIIIQNASTAANVPAADDLKKWIKKGIQYTGKKEIVVRVVDGEEIKSLNAQFRDKPQETNVLSFPANIPEHLTDTPVLGDIVICAPVVDQEALQQDKSLAAHWAHMLIHGVLHLQGYDHIESVEAEEMEALEGRLLGELGFADPYA